MSCMAAGTKAWTGRSASGHSSSGPTKTSAGTKSTGTTGFSSGTIGYASPTGLVGTGAGNATALNATANGLLASWWSSHRLSSTSSSLSPSSKTLSVYATAASSQTNKTTSSVTSTSSLSSSATGSAALPGVLRGANIGGWLVLEKWMNQDVFENTTAVDQWTFDQTNGAEAILHSHWSSYFQESDVKAMAAWGINAVRIPIGYWAYDNSNTPYITGADAYLEKAIEWCRSHGIQVLVDCHGSPGSQNGFDNSGRAGTVAWQAGNNLNQSISVLKKIAKKYGALEYADVVFGIEMVNEPISWGANSFSTTKQWAKQAYAAIKSVATNPDLNVIMHDGFMGPANWQAVGAAINGAASLKDSKFWIDVHLYQNQMASDSLLNQEQHIEKACNWSSTELLPSSSNLPVIVGEFTPATNICANPDGTTVAGSVCWESGCQCSCNVPVKYWNQPLVNATRQFFEAQLETFEAHSRGWFVWNYKGPGAWGLTNAVQYGLIGKTVTDRMYSGLCSS
ncbi:hypothetical protein MBLNU459_g3548t2 [Dothideomycetes sp. NU459]